MSTILTIPADAFNNRFYLLWLEPVLGFLTDTALSVYRLVLFISSWTVTIVTLGAPYLYYRLYRQDENDTLPSEKYSRMVKELDTLWDHYSSFLLPILPAIFPMVSLSGVSVCSIASFAATLTFTFGAASVGTRTIFKVRAKVLHSDRRAIDEWREASEMSWRRVPNKSFWILFSLPIVFFLLSIGLLVSTVVLTLWERPVTGKAMSTETLGCPVKRLQAFKYTFLTGLVATVMHFAFIIIKLHFLTTVPTTESTSVA